MANVDQVADTNRVELHRLAKLYPFPDFVKAASMDQTFNPGAVAHTVYADQIHRQFPCHTAASTWVSQIFFQEKQAEFEPRLATRIQSRLDHYIKYWGIKAATDAAQKQWTKLHKFADSQLPDSDFGFVWSDGLDNKQRQLRMKNAMEVKTAAEWLQTYRDRLPWNQRHVIATKILEKAAHYGASLGKAERFIAQQAGHGVCKPKAVADMLLGRAKLAKFDVHKQEIIKLATIVRDEPQFSLAPDRLVKLAETVDNIDRSIGLVGRYTDMIPRPEDVIFSATYKEVQAGYDDSCAMISGTVYDQEDFKKVALSEVQAIFGSDIANAVNSGMQVDPVKMADVAATLPLPDAELFDSLMAEAGVAPIQVKQASVSHGLSPELMASASATY